MNELKARTARSIANEEEILELEADCPIEQAQVYLKSEADKHIGELKKEIAELKEGAKNLILDNYLQDKEIRRQKHKRCLANAEACMHKRWRPDEGFDYARSTRHMKKWLEFAEQFKEKK